MPAVPFLGGINLGGQSEVQGACLESLAARPSTPTAGRIIRNSTSSFPEVWIGSRWLTITDQYVTSVSGSGPVQIGGTALAPVVSVNVATGSADGLMPQADKAKLDAATTAATANTLAFRDSSGNISANQFIGTLSGNASSATNASNLNSQPGSYYLSRANHTGQQTVSTLSDFSTAVAAFRLDQFAVPTADLNLNNKKLTNVAPAVAGTDVPNLNQVQAYFQGLDAKPSCRVMMTTNVNVNSPGATLDTVTMAANDRVFLQGQTDPIQNGPWIWNGAAVAMTRPNGVLDTLSPGSTVFIEDGSANYKGTTWSLITTGTIVVGTTAQNWTQTNGASQIVAGAALLKTGNQLDVQVDNVTIEVSGGALRIKSSATAGQVLRSAGTGAAAAWGALDLANSNATTGTLPLSRGGLGATTAAGARSTIGAIGKYAQDFGNGVATSFTITHSLGTDDVTVSVQEKSTGISQIVYWKRNDSNSIIIDTAPYVPTANQYRVTITG